MFFRFSLLTPLSSFAISTITGVLAIFLVNGCASTRQIAYTPPPIAQTKPSVAKQTQTSIEKPQEALPPHAPEPIQILGGVKNPGNIPYREGADLAFYLSKAGSTARASDLAKIQIIRGKPGNKKAQEFSLGNGSSPSLQSGDIVIVHAPKKTFIEKTFTVAASAAALLGTAALLLLIV